MTHNAQRAGACLMPVSCTERNPLTHHSVAPTHSPQCNPHSARNRKKTSHLLWRPHSTDKPGSHLDAGTRTPGTHCSPGHPISGKKKFLCSDYPTATNKTRPASRGQRMGFLQEVNLSRQMEHKSLHPASEVKNGQSS